ncbi:MAG: hypothetical protein HOF90_03140 [Euryarchaeota archaeon]|nr:hypothetical protein [Euryarchaeota archaeon]
MPSTDAAILPAKTPFPPKMLLSVSAEKHLLIGTNGEIICLDENFASLGESKTPFPSQITKACICGDFLIGVWIDHEILTARLAALPLELDFENGVGRDEIRINTKSQSAAAIHVKGAIWSHALTAEPLALTSIEGNYAFALWNRGVYFHHPDSEAIWARGEITWEKLSKYSRGNELFHLHEYKGDIMAWSRGGGWAVLSNENGDYLEGGILELPEVLDQVFYHELGGWLLTCGDSVVRMADLSTPDVHETAKLAGPIGYAVWDIETNSWLITGWRQDMIWGEQINWTSRRELGIHISKIEGAWCVLSNSGEWSRHLVQ